MTDLSDLIKDKSKFAILIVDDKVNMRRTIRNMLRIMGLTNLREAEDGDVALRKIKSEKLDFVICDWNMPRMNGVEVLRAVREDDRYKDLPFLMITAEVEEGTVAESIEAEVDGYILKPFVPKTLEDKMASILVRRLTPSAMDTQLKLAGVHMKAKNYKEVHAVLDEAAKISPRSPKLHYARGLTFEAEGKLEDAVNSFKKAREVGPKFIKAHEKLAELYEKLGKSNEMVSVLKEAVKVSPKNPDRQTRLGKALLSEGRVQEAKKAFNQAILQDPDNPDRMTAIGEAYLANGLAQEAEKAFKASIQNNPHNVFVYNRLGIAFRRQKKFDEAILLYQKALTIDPEEQNLYYNLARAYLGAGLKPQAEQTIKKALQINPDFKEALDLLNRMELN